MALTRPRTCAWLASLCLVVLLPRRATAEVASRSIVTYAVDGPRANECPSQATFVEGLERALSEKLARSSAESVTSIDVRVDAGTDSFRGVVRSSSPETQGVAERVLAAPSCVELAEAVAIIVVLTLEPGGRSLELPVVEKPPAVPTNAAPATRAPPAPPEGAPAIEATDVVDFGLDLGVGATWGLLPGTAVVAEVDLVARFLVRPYPEIHAGARVLAPTEVAAAEGTIRFWGLAAQLAGCPAMGRVGPFAFGGCAGVDIVWVMTRSSGFVDETDSDVGVVSLTAAAHSRAEVASWFAFRVDATLGVPLMPTSWKIDGLGVVHETFPVNGSALGFAAFTLP
jgi:hypothetical protein